MEYFPKIVERPGLAGASRCPGVEADDVIATLVDAGAQAKGWEVVIYSADKDIMQLIGDGVTMIDALHQKTYTREEVIKKMGVPPEKIPDFLALVGDTSDNIPGIKRRRRQDRGEPARAVRHAREPDRGRTRSCRGSRSSSRSAIPSSSSA